jgi:hypothetical protein
MEFVSRSALQRTGLFSKAAGEIQESSINVACGQESLSNNTSGGFNTAVGNRALVNNTTGSSNIAIGRHAGGNLTTGSNNIDVENPGVAGEENTIRIGTPGTQTATFIAGIQGVTVANGLPVLVSPNGQLGTLTSSVRFKEATRLHPVRQHNHRSGTLRRDFRRRMMKANA